MLLLNAGIILLFFLFMGLFGVWLMPVVIAELHLLLEPRIAQRPVWNIFGYLITKKNKYDSPDDFEHVAQQNRTITTDRMSEYGEPSQFPFFLLAFIVLISSAIMFAIGSWLGLLVSVPLLAMIFIQRATIHN